MALANAMNIILVDPYQRAPVKTKIPAAKPPNNLICENLFF